MRSVYLAIFILISESALARPPDQWSKNITIQQWFQGLMQPDNPQISCCGTADSFEADNYGVEGDHYIAIITDGYGTWPNGTRIPVPNAKIKWDNGNPTGHGVLFLKTGTKEVYCYAPPTGG